MALIFFPFSSSTLITYSHKSHRHPTAIKAQNSSPPPPEPTDDTSPAANSITTSPLGFGSKQKGKKERSRIIRREPVETPKFVSQRNEQGLPTEQGANERAFLLAWLGLGSIIIVEGIALAASGFLPEEWDTLFVKYLYPSFTPTVFLFVAGTVVYGVVKYLENEKPNSSS
ncbi:protein LPA2-like [Bidens hawaiensis]|uniref:protein LPA2-like n=1 Tax=Bidens hawaiensis TaxID=980011 RepID=UPI0040491053